MPYAHLVFYFFSKTSYYCAFPLGRITLFNRGLPESPPSKALKYANAILQGFI